MSSNKSARSHSIHVVIARDYQRIKRAERQAAKLNQEYIRLERKMNSNVKWNERINNQFLQRTQSTHLSDQPPITLDEFLVQERIRQDKINNAKKVANENIRRH